MPFQKGDDPNRSKGGRPKRSIKGKSLPVMAREHTEEALKFLVRTMKNDNADDAVRVRCAETLLNRGWGMAKQTIDVSNTVEVQHQVTFDASSLDLEVRKQILELMRNSGGEVVDAEIIEPEPIENKTGESASQVDDAQ